MSLKAGLVSTAGSRTLRVHAQTNTWVLDTCVSTSPDNIHLWLGAGISFIQCVVSTGEVPQLYSQVIFCFTYVATGGSSLTDELSYLSADNRTDRHMYIQIYRLEAGRIVWDMMKGRRSLCRFQCRAKWEPRWLWECLRACVVCRRAAGHVDKSCVWVVSINRNKVLRAHTLTSPSCTWTTHRPRQPTLADPHFTWSCVTTSPGQPCVARPSFIKNKHFGGHSPSAARWTGGLSCRPCSVYWWSLVLDCLSIIHYLFSTFSLRVGVPFLCHPLPFVKSYLSF